MRILLIFSFLSVLFVVKGQRGFFVNDTSALFTMKKNGLLYVDGDFQYLKASPAFQAINGEIQLTQDFIFKQEMNFERALTNFDGARLRFVGNSDSRIIQLNESTLTDTAILFLNQLIIDKTSGNVYIDNNVSVRDTIFFEKGNVILDSIARVIMDVSLGTNSVDNNPYIIGETAQKRFTGDGYIYAKYTKPNNFTENQFNTGLYLNAEQSSTIEFFRGHKQQLYAGNGSIDRFFDISVTLSDTLRLPNSFSITYLPDVDYLTMGVDTARLGIFISKQFQDMDYLRLKNHISNHFDSIAFTDTNLFNHPIIDLHVMRLRVTLADTSCASYPISNLPNTLQHLCDVDTLFVQAFLSNSALLSQQCYWDDNSDALNRTFTALPTQQNIGVEIYDNRGCSTYDTLRIAKVADNPVSNFEFSNGCIGDSILLKNKAVIANGTITSEWNFGDGNILSSNDSLVYHDYLNQGAYTVKLSVTSNYGCVKDSLVKLPIYENPQAIIDYDMNCVFQNHEFSGVNSMNSTISDTTFPSYSNTAYIWKLDQAVDSQDSITSHSSYNLSLGVHTVSLVVKNAIGCKDSTNLIFTVYPTDSAVVDIQDGCINAPLVITNNSILNNSNASFTWKFSDGSIYHDTVPSKSFNTSGIKTAIFYIHSDDLCDDSLLVSFNVFDNPSSNFTSNQTACQGTTIDFIPVIVPLSSYNWQFGDGLSSSLPNPQHQYTNSGTYQASLEVTDSNLCTSITTSNMVIYANPVADFTHDIVCFDNPTHLTSTSTGNYLNHSWLINSNVTSNLNQLNYTFDQDGTHLVSLVVTDANQCSDTVSKNIFVSSLPTFSDTLIQTCGSNYILDASASGISYLWTPGNVTSSTFPVNQSGNYNVQITGNNGCVDNFPISVALNSIFQPNLGIDQEICESKILQAGISGADYEWSNGSTLSSLFINTPGTYWLNVTDQNGCLGSDTIQILAVHPRPIVNLGSDLILCRSEVPYQLNAGAQTNYLWNNGSTQSTLNVNNTGSYHVKVSNQFGCSSRDTVQITVNSNPVSLLTADSVVSCSSYSLNAGNNASFTYNWNDSFQGAVRTISQTGKYFVTITNPASNCSTLDSIYVKIGITPNIELGPNQTVCSNTPVIFDFSGTNYTFEWISSSQAIVSTSSVFSPTSSDIFIVKVKSEDGCEASDVVQVQFLPSPVIPNHAPVYYVCGTTPVKLKGSAFGTNNWTSNLGHSFATQNISVYEPGFYYLTSSVNNCSIKDTFELVYSPQQINAFYLVDTDTSKNLTMQFIDLSDPKPTSYLWKFGDGSTDTTANPKHVYYQANTYMSSLTVSNGYCISTHSKEIKQKSFFEKTPSAPVYKLDFDFINLYPNPTDNSSTLEIELNDLASLDIKLFNSLGQLLQLDSYENIKKLTLNYNLEELSSGLYYISISSESVKGSLSKRFKLIKSN